MRIVKDAEERKNEILDAAEELFISKGFDNASTNDILQKVGIARGTLYYHFKSKEDIMDALLDRYVQLMLIQAQQIADDKSIPTYERLTRAILALNLRPIGGGKEIIEHIHKPQNALMHQKTLKVVIKEVTPILTKIIEDGIEEGVFHTPYPYECTEMGITYANVIFDSDLVHLMEEEQVRRVQAFAFNLERLFGAENLYEYVMRMFGDGEEYE